MDGLFLVAAASRTIQSAQSRVHVRTTIGGASLPLVGMAMMSEGKEASGERKRIGDYPFDIDYMVYNSSLYETFLDQKMEKVILNLGLRELPIEVEVFPSPKKNFRNRARFGVSGSCHDIAESPEGSNSVRLSELGGTLEQEPIEFRMWNYGTASVCVDNFPIACTLINEAMTALRVLLHNDSCHESIAGVRAANFLSTTTKDCLVVTLIYEKRLDEELWLGEGVKLKLQLEHMLGLSDLSIIARAKKQKLVLGKGFVTERFHLLDSRVLVYKQVEDGFSNPNGSVNKLSLEWLCSVVGGIDFREDGVDTDLLEMYCGNGNHTVALSAFVRRVFAVELNKSLCAAANDNLHANGISNVNIVCGDSEKFSERILKAKRYVCKDSSDGSQIEYTFSAVLVDPPRAGLDEKTRSMVRKYKDIIYISCNPDALKRDLNELCIDHDIRRFAFFDHFAYTPHLECGVYLTKR